MGARAKALFTEQEQAQETGLEEEGEYAFHGERLADYAAGHFREFRPVGAELKFHGNAGNYAHGEADAEDFRPETRSAIPLFVAAPEGDCFEDQDQKSETHGELRENVVERDGEGELKAMDCESFFHADCPPGAALDPCWTNSTSPLRERLTRGNYTAAGTLAP